MEHLHYLINARLHYNSHCDIIRKATQSIWHTYPSIVSDQSHEPFVDEVFHEKRVSRLRPLLKKKTVGFQHNVTSHKLLSTLVRLFATTYR